MGATRPRLRIGLVGAGMIGRTHTHAYRNLQECYQPPVADVELKVVADVDPKLTEDARARYGFERVATRWEEVLEAKDVDVVSIALPNFQHREVAEALAASGKHVLCEKPLAATASDAAAMLEAVRRAGVVHGVGFNLRRTPAVAAIRQAIQSGCLGEIRQFNGRYFTDYAASPEVPFTWRYRRDLAGSGALGDIGSHIIDLARFLCGEIVTIDGATASTFIARRPVPRGHVTGHARVENSDEFREVDTDDVIAFSARFANGAVGNFHFSRVAIGYRNSPAFEIIGSKGAAHFDMERAGEFGLFEHQDDEGSNGFRRVVVGPNHPQFGNVAAFPVAGVGISYTETFIVQAHEFLRGVVEGNTDYAPSFADGHAVAKICDEVLAVANGK
ncbi:MAG TPA: Gfo/Idh/MocA family oxidoreductase [Chloroflexota bacterium]|nr:Gfo/Idh/MocA family oxidoreductase [Chloroflexota bacterium]